MARPIPHRVTPVSHDPARDEIDDLVAALHESGLLRALAGVARRWPEAAAPAVQALATDDGQRALETMLVAAGALGRVDPDGLDRLVTGVAGGLAAARATLADDPPGPVELARRLGDPDVRRGAAAALALVGALGRAVRTP